MTVTGSARSSKFVKRNKKRRQALGSSQQDSEDSDYRLAVDAGQIDLFGDDFLDEKVVLPKKPFLKTTCAVNISEQPGQTPRQFYFKRNSILSEAERDCYLILGFDTEYQTLKETFTLDEVKAGKARYEVLSYQFYAINFTGDTWEGIAIPQPGKRLTLGQFIVYAISKGAQLGYKIPKTIVLVSHYDRADLPAFDDWDQLVRKTQNVRNSLVSPNVPLLAEIRFSDEKDDTEKVHIYLRDTMLAAAAGKKSLAALGDLIGVPKMKLDKNPANETVLKKSMRSLRTYQWPLFRDYAIHDAKIAALYLKEVTRQREEALGEAKFVPTTLSSIGVELLLKEWRTRQPEAADALEMVGREKHRELVWSEKKSAYIKRNLKPYIEEIHWHLDYAAECFHGGRNEQFWFGPSFEDDWSDFDLTSAYPVAMAMLFKPHWRLARDTTSIEELMEPGAYGFASVEFRFPPATRYPTLPVRTANGPIFPLEGRSYCCTPELIVARDLGCKFELRRGLILPHDPDNKVFFPFIQDTIARRRSAKPDIEKAFWKEVTNSCYGKTAQGLREKRVYSLKSDGVEAIPSSKISNPFYAATITSTVRATIGEIMNRLPADKMVFSVTTDGFITNANDEEIGHAKRGAMATRYTEMVKSLTGEDDLLKEKHAVRQLLGWRTRGQATLMPGEVKDDDSHIVIARAGLKPPIWATRVDEQNNWVIKTFFERAPGMEIPVDTHVTLREQLAYGADLVTKRVSRKTPMEYDFKRKPLAAKIASAKLPGSKRSYAHLVFSTVPWKNADEFRRVRSIFDDYRKKEGICLKTLGDFKGFADFIEIMWSASPGMHPPLRDPSGLSQLKRNLCRAFKRGMAGLEIASATMTAGRFAELLTQVGIPTTVEDVENGKRYPFKPNVTPKTAPVSEALRLLAAMIPLLDASVIVAVQQQGAGPALADAIGQACQFVDRLAD